MAGVTQPLRDEHKELFPHLNALRETADNVGRLSEDALRQKVHESYEFLRGHLLPHAQAEEAALYPVVARIMGAPEATATMSRDHVEIGRMIAELGSLSASISSGTPTDETIIALRRVLYGLFALVYVHFVKEEEVYLPLLDARLAPKEADDMFEAMETEAAKAKQGDP